ncbi:hypothetical protein EVA_13732 [gut metagenome]|uniref:Uncharacterized protein n=1 Tax=gut metagenome TaxID=749906 RepID=J9FT80_9ZZZZ
MLRLFIIRQIITHHFAHMKIIRQLKGQYRVENFFLTHFVNILFRT